MTALASLLERQKELIEFYFERVDVQEVENVVSLIDRLEGLVVCTGVGKSGIIAEKIAMTLISTGTRALFLPAGNVLHGDLGILSNKDVLLLLSRSGETEELLELLPFAQKRGTTTVAVVSRQDSRLPRHCDLSVLLPMEKELCPLNLAPTTSTAIQLLFGDLLAISLMQVKKIDLSTYADNHPAGTLGKNATLSVGDIMWKEEAVPYASPQDRLIDVLVELSNKKCGALVIAGEKRCLKGIFTDGDLRRSLQRYGPKALEMQMEALMTPNPLFVNLGTRAIDALKTMQRDPRKYVLVLPVVDQARVVGILRMHDIVQAGIG